MKILGLPPVLSVLKTQIKLQFNWFRQKHESTLTKRSCDLDPWPFEP